MRRSASVDTDGMDNMCILFAWMCLSSLVCNRVQQLMFVFCSLFILGTSSEGEREAWMEAIKAASAPKDTKEKK